MNTLFLYRTTPRIRLKEFNALAEPKVAEAVNEREKTLEAELRDELAGRFATLRNSGENKFVGLV